MPTLESQLTAGLEQGPQGPVLEDGSRVAVLGGGPAGSLFSYFLKQMAATLDVDVDVVIYEPRFFTSSGPAGCNHCGGVVSESLVQLLATEGINLPVDVVQRGIDSYVIHMDVGTVRIDTPLHEKRIAALYRGNGPRTSEPSDVGGFDRFLQDLATTKGVRIRRQLVERIDWTEGRPAVVCPTAPARPAISLRWRQASTAGSWRRSLRTFRRCAFRRRRRPTSANSGSGATSSNGASARPCTSSCWICLGSSSPR